MALDNFRTIELIWDKANKSVIKTIKTASSDTTGRYFSVKVLDEGQEVDLTGAKLQLYWEHPNFNTNGTDDFTTIDTKGLFKLTFSDEMLTNIGELNAHLVLTLTDGKITSGSFPIKVFKGADNGVVVPTNGNGLVEQIDGKIDKGNVTLNDLTQEVKLAMTGGAVAVVGENAVGTENIKDSAVTLDKVSFSKKGKNLFDKSKATLGFVNNATGAISSSTTYYASDFMPTKPNTQYTRSHYGRLAFYDASKAFISGLEGFSNHTITTPTLTAYTRHTIENQTALDTFQFEEGSVRTAYEPYKEPQIESKYLEDKDIDFTKIPDNSISKEKLDFITTGKNLVDVTKSTKGYYVNQANGSVVINSLYEATDYIPINGGDKLTISNIPTNVIRHAFYTQSFSYISGAVGSPMPLTAPYNASHIRFSYNVGTYPQLEVGDVATTYEPYKEILKGVTVEGIDTGNNTSDFKVNFTMPPKIYGVVGQELNIYFKNIIDQKDTTLDFDVDGSFGKQMTDRFTGVPEQATTTNIGISAYKNYEQVGLGNASLVTTNIATKDVKVLYFGDSTVNAGGVTKRLLDLYSAEPSSLTLLGTRGLDSTNRYEGRGGWSGATYRTPTEIYGATNPFYNPDKSDFDFSYYMNQQSYSGLDHFIIQLGINDTFGMTSDEALQTKIDTILSDFDYIINDVKSYDPNIKVGVTVTIPPNASQDAFGNAYGNGQTQWRYKRNNALWTQRLIAHYKDKDAQGIYLVPMQHNIDTTNNIADAVHPTQAGYDQMGDSVYAYLKNIG